MNNRIYTGVGRHTPIKVQLAFAACYLIFLAALVIVFGGAIL